jgi:nitrite reductase/ring-hydroxylating ferredoxin subunit
VSATTDAPDQNYWRFRPRAPALGTVLGSLDSVAEGHGKEFVFGRGISAFSMFVVRQGDTAYGYLNLCPHFSLKLNQRGDQFLNDDASLIRCTSHFAEFRIADGFCIAGACEGSFLDPVPVHVAAGQLVIGPDPT